MKNKIDELVKAGCPEPKVCGLLVEGKSENLWGRLNAISAQTWIWVYCSWVALLDCSEITESAVVWLGSYILQQEICSVSQSAVLHLTPCNLENIKVKCKFCATSVQISAVDSPITANPKSREFSLCAQLKVLYACNFLLITWSLSNVKWFDALPGIYSFNSANLVKSFRCLFFTSCPATVLWLLST